ncbi:MAG: FAD-dependent oxidoreductase [Rhizobacter sp.]|nr:FAD-dependent oxidoreductase [Rhizobacter sp.]
MKAVIAGAGLAGRLCAWRLARAGWQVSLHDMARRDDTRSASAVAAAMLSPLAELVGSDLAVYELALRAMALLPRWLDELLHDSDCRVTHRRDGTLVVAHAADAGSLQQFERVLRHKLPAAHHAQLQPLHGEAIGECEPLLAGRFECGLYLAGEGQLANDELLHALAVALTRLQVRWHEGEAVPSLHGLDDKADVFIDTRGLGARGDWPGLRGVRGELLTLECRGVSLRRPVRLMHPRHPLYVVPRPGQRFVVGATELESEDNGPVSLRSMLELGSALHSLHPAFGEARVLHVAAALRPALDDHRPTLRWHDGVWQLNGLYRHGYLCAPALVDDLMGRLTP